jgi:hypothetical protein
MNREISGSVNHDSRARNILLPIALVGVVIIGGLNRNDENKDPLLTPNSSAASGLIFEEAACTPTPEYLPIGSLALENAETGATPVSFEKTIYGPPIPLEMSQTQIASRNC